MKEFAYEGELLNGKPHGQGVAIAFIEDKQTSFEGAFVNGKPEGFAVFTNISVRNIWSGEFKDGELYGKATLYKLE